jgi:hypothetical protein
MTNVWSAEQISLGNGNNVRVRLSLHQESLSVAAVLATLSTDTAFRSWFTGLLANNAFRAYYWELPPLSSRLIDVPFEFVLTDAPELASCLSDPSPFQKQFGMHPSQSVVSFSNLGGDAFLIVPKPMSATTNYTHLSAFLRTGQDAQIHEFWKTVADTVTSRISATPIWVSTAGLGASWLHLRLDSRPKYYRYAPYKPDPAGA